MITKKELLSLLNSKETFLYLSPSAILMVVDIAHILGENLGVVSNWARHGLLPTTDLGLPRDVKSGNHAYKRRMKSAKMRVSKKQLLEFLNEE